MLKKILLILAAIIVIVLVAALFQPAEFRVTRSATIAAPAATVFAEINDFHRWQAWSPWEKLDPTMKRTFEGPASGVGASYGWEGNSDVGAGRMTISESKPAEIIRIKLEFLKPMQATNLTTFNPVTIAFHEWLAILRDVRRSQSPREAFLRVFGPPGWSPDGSSLTSKQMRAR